jgi:hypothetical protein
VEGHPLGGGAQRRLQPTCIAFGGGDPDLLVAVQTLVDERYGRGEKFVFGPVQQGPVSQ